MDWLLALEDLGDVRVDELDPIAPVDVIFYVDFRAVFKLTLNSWFLRARFRRA